LNRTGILANIGITHSPEGGKLDKDRRDWSKWRHFQLKALLTHVLVASGCQSSWFKNSLPRQKALNVFTTITKTKEPTPHLTKSQDFALRHCWLSKNFRHFVIIDAADECE
jgi:hypothetical protein